jgi:hypothetical protein
LELVGIEREVAAIRLADLGAAFGGLGNRELSTQVQQAFH